MNYLAALAEMAVRPTIWGEDLVEDSSVDRSVVDTTVEEFPKRMGALANYMTGIYREIFNDFLETI
jgi:hypothetical protein